MAAPKGNKYAVGNKGNWVRTVWTDERIAEVSKQLDEWSRKDDSLTMLQFGCEYDILQSTLLEAVERHKDLNDAYKQAKHRVGVRRELKALKGEINSGLVQRTLRLYSDEQNAHDNKEIYDKSYNDTKGKLDAVGGDEGCKGAILEYLESQKK